MCAGASKAPPPAAIPLLLTDSPHIDPERLAALLDGRLDAAQAAAVRAQLATASDDILTAYADAVTVSAELTRDIAPISSARGGRRWLALSSIGAVAAAALAVVVVRSERNPSAGYRPGVLAAAIPLNAPGPDAPVWGTTRGGAVTVEQRSRSVRIGALLVDLEVGMRRDDHGRAAAGAIARLLQGVPVGATASAPLQAYADSRDATMSTDRRRELGQMALQLMDGTLADAGAYLEAARLATSSGDASFFDAAPASVLTRLERRQDLDSTTRSAVKQLISLTAARPRDAVAIHTAIEDLLRILAR